ncbi:MAG: EamA family transporter [Pseudomonadota bacterium]
MVAGYLWVALAVAASSGSQIVQAHAAQRLSARAGLIATLSQPLVLIAYALLGVSLVCWLLALTRLDVSRTYPFFALGFVAVMLYARLRLRQSVPPRAWLGCALIVLGGALCGAR